jgi:hypothetical protein
MEPPPIPPPLPPNPAPPQYVSTPWERIIAAAASLYILGLITFLVVKNQPLNDNYVVMVRTLLSLSVASLGATIPGFLHIGWDAKGTSVRAGGALALFLLTYTYTPRVLSGNDLKKDGTVSIRIKESQYADFVTWPNSKESAQLPKSADEHSWLRKYPDGSFVTLSGPLNLKVLREGHSPEGEAIFKFMVTTPGGGADLDGIYLDLEDVYELPPSANLVMLLPTVETYEDRVVLERGTKSYRLFQDADIRANNQGDILKLSLMAADSEGPGIFKSRLRINYNVDGKAETAYSPTFFVAKIFGGPTHRLTKIAGPRRTQSQTGQARTNKTQIPFNSARNNERPNFFNTGAYQMLNSIDTDGFCKRKPKTKTLRELTAEIPGAFAERDWAKSLNERRYCFYKDFREFVSHASNDDRQSLAKLLVQEVNKRLHDPKETRLLASTIPFLAILFTEEAYASLTSLLEIQDEELQMELLTLFRYIRFSGAKEGLLKIVATYQKTAMHDYLATAILALEMSGDEESGARLLDLYAHGKIPDEKLQYLAITLIGSAPSLSESLLAKFQKGEPLQEFEKKVAQAIEKHLRS